jgi:hypothetical protein
MSLDSIFSAVIAGIFAGIGSSIGSYIAIKYFVDHLDNLTEKKAVIPKVGDRIKIMIKKIKDDEV